MELIILKGKIRGAGKTYADIAKELGIGINTLSNKLNGSSEFMVSEIVLIANILRLSNQDIFDCFFPARMSGVS